MKKIEVLKKAKEFFLNYKCDYVGMCFAIKEVILNNCHKLVSYSIIEKNIPEFYPRYFGSSASPNSYWWRAMFRKPRIEAFDKLIELYKDNDEEFVV